MNHRRHSVDMIVWGVVLSVPVAVFTAVGIHTWFLKRARLPKASRQAAEAAAEDLVLTRDDPVEPWLAFPARYWEAWLKTMARRRGGYVLPWFWTLVGFIWCYRPFGYAGVAAGWIIGADWAWDRPGGKAMRIVRWGARSVVVGTALVGHVPFLLYGLGVLIRQRDDYVDVMNWPLQQNPYAEDLLEPLHRARARHDEAVRIVLDHEPWILYLRDFQRSSDLVYQAAGALPGRTRVVALAIPDVWDPGPYRGGQDEPVLCAGPRWRDTVQELIRRASVIVIRDEKVRSSGLEAELQMINSFKAWGKCVALRPERDRDAYWVREFKFLALREGTGMGVRYLRSLLFYRRRLPRRVARVRSVEELTSLLTRLIADER